MSCVVCSPPPNGSGSFYTRWGRTSCPNDTETVYSGRAASSRYDESGSGANNLCLVQNPLYLEHNDIDHSTARLQGIRYFTSGYGIHSLLPVHGRTAPCAVCMIPRKDTNVMVPGSNRCPNNWKVEYKGYLMANLQSGRKINYVCVDEQPESLESSSATQGRWYPTETKCGRIECQPGEAGSYYANWELTCAVCSPDTTRRDSLFTHWGSNTCPNKTRTVYSGFIGGSGRGDQGNGANLLCMHAEALYSEHETNGQGGAVLYGYEYETNGKGIHSAHYVNVHQRQVYFDLV